MKTPRGQKLMASFGVLAILLGTPLVIAPSAGAIDVEPDDDRLEEGGNLPCANLDSDYIYEAVDETTGAETSGSFDEDGIVGTWELDNGEVTFDVTEDSRLISAIVVKTGNATNASSSGLTAYETFDPPVTSGAVDYSEEAISNVRLCARDQASLTVTKVLTDEGDATFPFTLDDVAIDESPLGDGESETFSALSPGTYTLAETSGDDYDLDDIECVDAQEQELDEGAVAYDLAGESVDVTLVDGDDITCTFTNEPVPEEEASLTVVKVLTDEGDATFPFTLDDVAIDESPLGDGESETFSALSPDTYTLAETSGDDYDLDSIECVDAQEEALGEGAVAYDLAGESVDVTLADGDDVTCTFTNEPVPEEEASLTVTKVLDGTGVPASGTDFTFGVACTDDEQSIDLGDDASFSWSADDGTKVIDGLPAGAECTITETEPTSGDAAVNYEDTEVLCTGEEVAAAASSGDVTVVEADTVGCTFTNNYDEPDQPQTPPSPSFSVDIDKLNDANGDDLFTDSEPAPAEEASVEFQVTIENTGTGTLTLSSLTDSFDETTVDLLEDVALDCDGTSLTVGSSLPADSTTVCTFTLDDYAPVGGSSLVNTVTIDTDETGSVEDDSTVLTTAVLPEEEEAGSIEVVKAVEGPNDGSWTFSFEGPNGENFDLTQGESTRTFGQLLEGQYTITEGPSDLATLVGIDCGDADVSASVEDRSVTVDLAEGEDVSCTFTNQFPTPQVEVEEEKVEESEVLPDVVTKPTTLPRTGSGTQNLAGLGVALIGFGAVLLAGSRRRQGFVG